MEGGDRGHRSNELIRRGITARGAAASRCGPVGSVTAD
ncbi:hypothetical protein XCR_1589 [Xanthomonas campestris pv. raphani 756C]|nr:hypothetical protein XCR_1589 [Xanthomonas campestris pv. raphani 756C]